MQNLLPEPPATMLPADDAAAGALADSLDANLTEVAARFPSYSAAWAAL